MKGYVGETERCWEVRRKVGLAGKEDMLVFIVLLRGLQKILQVEEAIKVGLWTEIVESTLM